MCQGTWLLYACLVMLAGCAISKGGDAGSDTGTGENFDTFDTGDSGQDGDGPVPTWWTLSATLEIASGAVVSESSTVEVTVLDQEHAAICSVLAASPSVLASDELPDPTLFTWWRLGSMEWSDGCASHDVVVPTPSRFLLGVGEMHPEILAVLGSLGDVSDSAATSLNSAYASFDSGETIYVFGAAGLVVAYDGVGEALTGPPLTDGTWLVRPIYPFPLGVGK